MDLKELNYFVSTVIENSFICNISELNILYVNLFGVGGLINSNPNPQIKDERFFEWLCVFFWFTCRRICQKNFNI